MTEKITINTEKFLSDPFAELNNFIDKIYQEKKPFLISAKFIKVQCDNVYLEVNGEIKNTNINYCCFDSSGEIVTVDSRKIY
jgi:hypothetical protein